MSVRRAPARVLFLLPLACALAVGLLLAGLAPAAQARGPVEDYAPYQPQRGCSPKAKPGTVVLGKWLVRKYGGRFGSISRACGGSTSEHTGGRAFDWTLDADTRAGRRTARAFLRDAFATDRAGNPDARARRMGIMYVIWDDEIYSAWNGFQPEPYIHSACERVVKRKSGRRVVKMRRNCSQTLRHRDHVHISLTRAAGKGRTSWYDGRL